MKTVLIEPALHKVVYVSSAKQNNFISGLAFTANFELDFCSTLYDAANWFRTGVKADVLLIDLAQVTNAVVSFLNTEPALKHIPVVLVVPAGTEITESHKALARRCSADDIFAEDDLGDKFNTRLGLLIKKYSLLRTRKKPMVPKAVTPPLTKRLFDILVAGIALFLLSPIFILIAILIKLDSKGPVVYLSKRVGSGYKIFDLYKFRTMRTGADAAIKEMAAQNMYNQAKPQEKANKNICLCESDSCDSQLFRDNSFVCEKFYIQEKKQQAAFMKFQNDPRITRLGNFLRNTSLDELPQLYNILLGDMSLIGNRPLPLYEAEKLTTDEHIMRFAAPAGLTGLWQVSKRGKAGLTAEERIQLDLDYASNYSFLTDLKIIFKTFPALLQKENV